MGEAMTGTVDTVAATAVGIAERRSEIRQLIAALAGITRLAGISIPTLENEWGNGRSARLRAPRARASSLAYEQQHDFGQGQMDQ